MSALPELLTVADVARALGVSEKAVYHLKARRVLPAVKLGRAVRFRADDLQRLLRSERRVGGDGRKVAS